MCAHALASENMDLQVVGCMDWTRLRNEIETNVFNSFCSGNCQNTEISVCTFQFYEPPYKYGPTFTHAVVFFMKGWGGTPSETSTQYYIQLTSVCVMDIFQEFDFASKFELKSWFGQFAVLMAVHKHLNLKFHHKIPRSSCFVHGGWFIIMCLTPSPDSLHAVFGWVGLKKYFLKVTQIHLNMKKTMKQCFISMWFHIRKFSHLSRITINIFIVMMVKWSVDCIMHIHYCLNTTELSN